MYKKMIPSPGTQSFPLNLDCQQPTYSATFRSLSPEPTMPPKQSWEDLLELNPEQKSLISKIYGLFLSLDEFSLNKTMMIQEQGHGLKFTVEGWKGANKRTHTSSLSVPDLDSYSSKSCTGFIFLKAGCLKCFQK